MPKIVRIPISNVYMDGDYTGRILVGPKKLAMNVILDTGSSALALDGHKYQPDVAGGDQTTKLAQYDAYGDGSNWTGAVIKTTITVGEGASQVPAGGVSAAVAYDETADMFGQSDGILGLDDAFEMPEDTWTRHYSATEVRQGRRTTIVPYLTQLAGDDVVSDKVAFYT